MKLIFFLVLTLVLSCQKKSSVEYKDSSIIITPENMDIVDAQEVVWKVGPLRRQKVSKGVNIKVKFPQLKREDLEKTILKYEVDSWLIRVKRRTISTSQILGSLYVPLIQPGTFKKNINATHEEKLSLLKELRFRQMSSGFIRIYYGAAAISTRFEKFMCPAVDHNKVISEIDIKQESSRREKMYVSYAQSRRVMGRIEQFGYKSQNINGGESLKGTYLLDIALYDSKNKMRRSNFVSLNNSVIVGGVKKISIKGCENFKIPEKKYEDTDKVKKFKFGR